MPSIASLADAGSAELHNLVKRDTCYDRYRNRYYTCNRFSDGARIGVGVGIAVAVFFLIMLLSLCARRRKRSQGYVFRPANNATTQPLGYNPGMGGAGNPYAAGSQQPQYQQQGYPQAQFGQQQSYNNNYPPPQDGYKAPEGPPPAGFAADSSNTQYAPPPGAPPPAYNPNTKEV